MGNASSCQIPEEKDFKIVFLTRSCYHSFEKKIGTEALPRACILTFRLHEFANQAECPALANTPLNQFVLALGSLNHG